MRCAYESVYMRARKFILSVLLLVILGFCCYNYWPPLKIFLFGNGGDPVKQYVFKYPPGLVTNTIIRFKQNNKQYCPPNEKEVVNYENRITATDAYFKLYNNRLYYHIWVVLEGDSATRNNCWLIFGGVSETPDWKDADKINYMSTIRRNKTLQEFNDFFISKLSF